MPLDDLSSTDLEALGHHGLDVADVRRQLLLLRQPPPALRLLRPCTVGDGITRLDENQRRSIEARATQAMAAGAFAKFVPASGAATRLFGSLLSAWNETPPPEWNEVLRRSRSGDAIASDVVRLLRELERLPFEEPLQAVARRGGMSLVSLRQAGRWHEILTLLLTPEGLGMADRPKALVPFHRTGRGVVSALEEQVDEGWPYLCDDSGRERYHFTVAPGAGPDFERTIEALRSREMKAGRTLSVRLSEQSGRTDTVAVDENGELMRDGSGRPLLRPGGHGALLPNLAETDAELVFIRNIDNVLPAGRAREEGVGWRRVLGGRLVEARDRSRELIEALQSPDAGPTIRLAARQFLAETFNRPLSGLSEGDESERLHLISALDRPIRVCGMVPNEGEPGGGPFWVDSAQGPVLQIVEGAQVDLSDPAQRAVWNASTHFNPVDLVCCLRNGLGQPYRLEDYVDRNAVIVARKLVDGEKARVLERPGLWNGGMADWNSIFVEIPAQIFAPVKTVFDLLRPEHQRVSDKDPE